MEQIWANRLMATTRAKTWDEVPDSRKPGVREELLFRITNGSLSAEDYTRITGEELDLVEGEIINTEE